jgi:hypothetical protein
MHIFQLYEGVSKSFRTESITKQTTNTCWEATQRVMTAKLTRLTHKIMIQLHVVAESCTICSSRSRWPVQKLLDAPYLLTHSLTHSLTPWFRILFGKLTVTHLHKKKSCSLYGTHSFTKFRHWTLSWASRIQFASLIPIFLRSIVMLSFHLRLGLPNGLFPSGLPIKHLSPPLRVTCPSLVLPMILHIQRPKLQ